MEIQNENLLATMPQSVNASFVHPISCNNQLTLHATEEDPFTTINPSGAGEAFREHRGDLLIAITDPLVLANYFYSKRIISREKLNEIMLISLTDSKKNFILLDAIEARIRTNPSDFLTVLDVLGRDLLLCCFAERLRNSYCEFTQVKQ